MADDVGMATSTKKKPRAKKATPTPRKKAVGKAPAKPRGKAVKKAKATRSAGTAKKVAKNTARKPAKKVGKKAAVPERSSPAMAEVDADVLEFIAAIDRFKQENGRPFPSWSEVLLVIRKLGYRRK